jgi:hypothetical protein
MCPYAAYLIILLCQTILLSRESTATQFINHSEFILVPSASRPCATSLGPGTVTQGTGSARTLAVVSKADALELGRLISTHNNFHSEVLRRNKVFVC